MGGHLAFTFYWPVSITDMEIEFTDLVLTNFREYFILRKFRSRILRVFNFAIFGKKWIESCLISRFLNFFSLAKTRKDQLHLQPVFINCSSSLVTETKQNHFKTAMDTSLTTNLTTIAVWVSSNELLVYSVYIWMSVNGSSGRSFVVPQTTVVIPAFSQPFAM